MTKPPRGTIRSGFGPDLGLAEQIWATQALIWHSMPPASIEQSSAARTLFRLSKPKISKIVMWSGIVFPETKRAGLSPCRRCFAGMGPFRPRMLAD